MFIGLDIGTTSICASVYDPVTGEAVETVSCANASADGTWQDPNRIETDCRRLIEPLMRQYSIDGIGLTGQMHGIVYADAQGNACSRLATWQDTRGNLSYQDSTYAGILHSCTGMPCASGYGSVSLFYDTINHQIPPAAHSFCTISDYIGMCLTERKTPLLHTSNAASIGLFEIAENTFSHEAIRCADIPETLYPDVTSDLRFIGSTPEGIPVCCAIGDNQASVFGSCRPGVEALINIGTGGQVSICTKTPNEADGIEIRPYISGMYLLVGASLCGGRAFAELAALYRDVITMAGFTPPDDLLDRMTAAAAGAAGTTLHADTAFAGTRTDPHRRGSITGIGVGSLRAGDLSYAILDGIARELYAYYRTSGGQGSIAASGNGVRKNAVQRAILRTYFGKELYIPKVSETAAYGAAMCAAAAYGYPIEELRARIPYQE